MHPESTLQIRTGRRVPALATPFTHPFGRDALAPAAGFLFWRQMSQERELSLTVTVTKLGATGVHFALGSRPARCPDRTMLELLYLLSPPHFPQRRLWNE